MYGRPMGMVRATGQGRFVIVIGMSDRYTFHTITELTIGHDMPDTPAVETVDDDAPVAEPALRPLPGRVPPDRVHRTFYLDRDTDAAFRAAIDRVHSACRGMVPRHQIIAALIRRGLDAEAAVVAELKTQLRDRLNLD